MKAIEKAREDFLRLLYDKGNWLTSDGHDSWNACAEYLFRELEKYRDEGGYDDRGCIEPYVDWSDILEIFGREDGEST
jgi:hypothetical protein